MKSTHIIIVIILLIAVGAGAFYGGILYQKSQSPSFGQFGGPGGFYRRFGGQRGAGGQNITAVRGKITSVNATSITVQMQDGSSKIVLFSNSTPISKAASGSASDLTTGTEVMAAGNNNSDGSITAQTIQINPIGMRLFRGGEQGTPQPTQ